MDLENRKILFFSVAFFGYERKIKLKLEEFGAIVDLYNERSIESKFNIAIFKVFPRLFRFLTYLYYQKIINSKSNTEYDYIFIYGPDMIFKAIIRLLVRTFPNAELYMYNADSIKGNVRIEKIMPYFDKVFTYDRGDYLYYKGKFSNLSFRPLFFTDAYDCSNNCKNKIEYLYDICFIGTVHSDRQQIINEIEYLENNERRSFFKYSYLQSNFIFWFYKFTKKSFRKVKKKEYQFEKIDSSSISKIFNETRVVLDMQHPKNLGLTIRTIEALGMQKKLITTNTDILNYDFYNPQNIMIIPRRNINIDDEFFENDYEKTPKDILNRYTLDSWIKDIFV